MNKIPADISNPHRLTVDELMELAGYNIHCGWIGRLPFEDMGKSKIFGQEAAKTPAPGEDRQRAV